MCTQPVRIHNPYYNNVPLDANYKRFCPTSEFIEVPCGHCAECQQRKTSSMIQRCIIEALTSHVYNVTLTYNNEHLPIATYTDADGSTVRAPYFDVVHLQNLFKRFRKLSIPDGRQFRYFAVSEYGGKFHRPHAHLLLFVSRRYGETPEDIENLSNWLYDNILSNWVVNVGTNFHPVYLPLCTPATSVRDGQVYTNYQCKLVTPLEVGIDGKKHPVTDYAKYLEALNDPTFVVNYICKYLYKSDDFAVNISKFLQNNTFVTPDGDCLPRESLKRYYKTVATVRLCSKGLGFGFDPSTGLKVYLLGRNFNLKPTITHLASRDVIEDLRCSVSLPTFKARVSSLLLRIDYLRSFITSCTPFDLFPYFTDTEVRVFDLALLTNREFRLRIHELYPSYDIPSRIRFSSNSLDDGYTLTTLFTTLDHAPFTASVLAIISVLSSADNPMYNYPVFSFGSLPIRSLSSYYRAFLGLDFYRDFYDRRGIKDFEDLVSTFESADSRISSSVLTECSFRSKSVDYHRRNPWMRPLPYDVLFDNTSTTYVFGESELSRYYASLHRYELQYY